MPCAEHIRVACQIMTSCLLLGGRNFLRDHGQGLASTLAALTGTVNERGTLLLLPVEELMLQARLSTCRRVDTCCAALGLLLLFARVMYGVIRVYHRP